MADGRLGRCKDCHKSEIKRIFNLRMQDPAWREKELNRQRDKSAKARESGITPSIEATKKGRKKWAKINSHKVKAHAIVARAIRTGRLLRENCEKCGLSAQAHHDDYLKPLNVRWLCTKHHNDHHNEMRRLERFTMDNMKPINEVIYITSTDEEAKSLTNQRLRPIKISEQQNQ
jgi:hypothetical protein